MAPDAKITFFDVGAKGKDYLLLPPIQEIFDIAYESGARVHSNSWGNYGGIYGAMSYDLDKYLYDHPDFAVLFAVGNSGAGGLMTVNSPGNAKNCITVGASQVRVVLDDEMFILKNERVVASFSSLGPTFDGRIKPDVVAPGDFIMSAFAGSSDNIDAAILNNSQSFENCAAHQMSGTSMSTPITAGSFTPSGFFLKAMLIHSGEQMTRGSSAWLFTVVITDPQGLVAQVGGFNWFAQENNFYSRRWPDPWIGKLSMSKPWISTRDISDAGDSYWLPIRS
eukprot:gene17100-22613_t